MPSPGLMGQVGLACLCSGSGPEAGGGALPTVAKAAVSHSFKISTWAMRQWALGSIASKEKVSRGVEWGGPAGRGPSGSPIPLNGWPWFCRYDAASDGYDAPSAPAARWSASPAALWSSSPMAAAAAAASAPAAQQQYSLAMAAK